MDVFNAIDVAIRRGFVDSAYFRLNELECQYSDGLIDVHTYTEETKRLGEMLDEMAGPIDMDLLLGSI
jgi:hypothetical protein